MQKNLTIEERFWAKVNKTETCWLWTGRKNADGYGQFRPKGKSVYVHRWAYELLIGPIPDGLTIDHLCRVRNCVCAAHLEAVTNRENILRGEGVAAIHARQTHCLQGHPFDKDNTYYSPMRPKRRVCRECDRIHNRARNRNQIYWTQQKGNAS